MEGDMPPKCLKCWKTLGNKAKTEVKGKSNHGSEERDWNAKKKFREFFY